MATFPVKTGTQISESPLCKGERCSALFAEALDVFGAFLEWADSAALDEFADLFDDVGISKRGDVAGIHVVGNGGENAAHDFAGTRFGHVGNDVNGFGTGDFADHGLDRKSTR